MTCVSSEVVEMDVLIEDGDVIAFRTKLRLSYKRHLEVTVPHPYISGQTRHRTLVFMPRSDPR